MLGFLPIPQEREDRAGAPATRRAHGFVILALLAGCAADPSAEYIGGIGDPVRGAALYAPRNLGETGRWNGRPAEAAVAAEQLEFLADALVTDPRWAPVVNPAVPQALAVARAEMRGFLGVPEAAAPQLVITGLRRAAVALRDGSRVRAEAALSSAAFPLGPAMTLQRLSAMPDLPRTREAAGMVAAEFDRLDRTRG